MPKLISNNAIYPCQVFYAKTYDPFTNTEKSHPFVVWYSQEVDSDTIFNNNVYALRITTKSHNSAHLVEVRQPQLAKLKTTSYVVCDDVVIFDRNKIKIVGRLDYVTWLNVIKERQNKFNEEIVQNIIAFSNIKYFK